MERTLRRITRSRNERVFAGVCGGIAIYFGLDPVLIRVLYVALTVLSNGVGGVLVYIIGWIVIPLEGAGAATPYAPREPLSSRKSIVVMGAFLVSAGVISLMTLFFPAFWDVWDIRWIGPVVLVLAGIGMIIWQKRTPQTSQPEGTIQEQEMSDTQSSYQQGSIRRLMRIREGRKIAGVCTGFGTYFNIDPTIIRLIWLALIFLFGTGVLLYIICWIVMPLEPESSVSQHVVSPPSGTSPTG